MTQYFRLVPEFLITKYILVSLILYCPILLLAIFSMNRGIQSSVHRVIFASGQSQKRCAKGRSLLQYRRQWHSHCVGRGQSETCSSPYLGGVSADRSCLMWQVTKVQNRVVIENSKGRLDEVEIERMVAAAEKFAAEVRHVA